VNEEHMLLERGELGLLHQRRARRNAGQDPNIVHMRKADTVEHYKQ